MRMRLFAPLLTIAAALFAQNPQPATFLAVYKPGPGFVAGKPLSAQPLGEHARYMLSLYRKGVLKIAGPFTDDSGGAVMFSAASLDDARQIVAPDPPVISGVFIYDLHPWDVVDWNARAAK